MTPLPKEAALEQTCTEFLELDGWRSLKTDPVSRREWGKGFGEKGMADYLYIRYCGLPKILLRLCKTDQLAQVEMFWVEYKTPKGRIAHHQHAWREREQSRGALALIAGIDFPATIEGFISWYQKSGLERRRVRIGGIQQHKVG